MTALLSVTDVSKRFRGLAAVSRVSFDVQPGEIFAVIGPNGAGKTTLFNMIAGAMAPDGGSITFAGERIDGLRADEIARRGIGRTFQLVKPFPALYRRGQCRDRRADARPTRWTDARKVAHEIMSQLDLFGKRAQIASSLTLPDRKRLEVARALATRPKLLLLDEVMAGLRPTETDRIVAILRELNRDGLTILLIEHVMRAVTALASKILVLHHGAAIAEGTPEHCAARTRRDRILSRRGVAVMLEVENISVFYGDAQALDDVSLDRRGRDDRGDRRRQRRRQDLADPHHRAACTGRPPDASCSRAPISPACRATASATSASARSPRDGRYFPRSRCAENLDMGAMLPRARRQPGRRTASGC